MTNSSDSGNATGNPMYQNQLLTKPALVGLAASVLVYFQASRIAGWMGDILPWRAQVSSAGTQHAIFSELAPEIVERNALVALAAIASVLLWRWLRQLRLPSGSSLILAVTVPLISAAWITYLAHPHNAFPTNSRFHWVDFIGYESDRFFYVAGRLPHYIFYETPYVWQGLNSLALSLCCYLIGRRLGHSRGLAAMLGAFPAISGNMLLFANTAEDVFINHLLLFGVILASLSRRSTALGIAIALAVLGRPSFILLAGCAFAAEAIYHLRSGKALRSLLSGYIMRALVVLLAIIVSCQVIFTIMGTRYFFINGRVIDTGRLDVLTPRAIDGFTISPFSGTYIGHLLWVMPLVFLLAAAVTLLISKDLDQPIQTTAYLSALFIVGHLLTHEAKPLVYYNVRYLTYIVPFLFFLAWAGTAHKRFPADGPLRAGLLVALLLGPTVFPAKPLEVHDRLANRAEHELLDIRHEFRAISEGKEIYVDFGANSSLNYIVYVLRTDTPLVLSTADQVVSEGGFVVALQSDYPTEAPVLLQTEHYVIYDSMYFVAEDESTSLD